VIVAGWSLSRLAPISQNAPSPQCSARETAREAPKHRLTRSIADINLQVRNHFHIPGDTSLTSHLVAKWKLEKPQGFPLRRVPHARLVEQLGRYNFCTCELIYR
jgi:hypothetical protein